MMRRKDVALRLLKMESYVDVMLGGFWSISSNISSNSTSSNSFQCIPIAMASYISDTAKRKSNFLKFSSSVNT